MAHRFFIPAVLTTATLALFANSLMAEPVIRYANSKPLKTKTKVVKVVGVNGAEAAPAIQTAPISQPKMLPMAAIAPIIPVAPITPVETTEPAPVKPIATVAALPKLQPLKPVAAIKPLPALKPMALAPVKAESKLNTLSTSKVVVQPLTPLTPVKAAPAPKKESVSPLGQFLAGAFSWIDDVVTITPVKPWQKSILAEPVMSAAGVNAEQTKFAKKVFISKEASSGGDGVAGGGCGCK